MQVKIVVMLLQKSQKYSQTKRVTIVEERRLLRNWDVVKVVKLLDREESNDDITAQTGAPEAVINRIRELVVQRRGEDVGWLERANKEMQVRLAGKLLSHLDYMTKEKFLESSLKGLASSMSLVHNVYRLETGRSTENLVVGSLSSIVEKLWREDIGDAPKVREEVEGGGEDKGIREREDREIRLRNDFQAGVEERGSEDGSGGGQGGGES